jgi:cellulose synthase/poly-beta-1,6-N-acetylglucosamine synthase-like glycosyltransferase
MQEGHDQISVIIAVRNESESISDLLNDLNNQRYSSKSYEVIVVDDHSTDSTSEVVLSMKKTVNFNLVLVRLSETEGKKAAIKMGIKVSNPSTILIVSTDADCRVKPGWLNEISIEFRNENIDLIFGPVAIRSAHNLFTSMQEIELTTLQVTGASTLKVGFPTMCNGANIAYRRNVFDEVGGFKGNEHLASGDDEFLMHKVYQRDPRSVRFLKSNQAIVVTRPLHDISDFINQRRRWSSKWEGYKSLAPKFLALFIFVTNLTVLGGILFSILGYIAPTTVTGILLVKLLLEFLLLALGMKFFGQKIQLKIFLILELLYPFYVLIFALGGRYGKYLWKGRKLK